MDSHRKNDDDAQGFSQQQQDNQRSITTIPNQVVAIDQDQMMKYRKKVMISLQPASEIKTKQYSLEPDMLSGWKPKIYICKPIPLTFDNDELDYSIDTLIKLKTYMKEPTSDSTGKSDNQKFSAKDYIQLIYLGPRYQSTYSAWYEKPFPFPYTHLNTNKRLKFTDREFVGQYWYAQTQDYLRFDSFFQSGNLDVAFKVGEFQYELLMRIDANTRGHCQWYNFKVRNMQKGMTYKFNICNFSKAKSLYARGMKPFVFSTQKSQYDGSGWIQCGQNVKYQRKVPKTFHISKTRCSTKPYRLSFQYDCAYSNDQVQFCYSIPYEYSKLKSYLQSLEKRCADRNFLSVSKLCKSLGGLQIPIITITKDLRERQDIAEQSQKKLIFIAGRIHPGESNGSYVMQGLIDYICNDSEQSQILRRGLVFKIVPMLNPDGVVIGNYRTSLSGNDLNRQFVDPDEDIFPEVYHLKQRIQKYRNNYGKDFLMFLDLHGHSTKKNVFTYGPDYPITNSSYYESRIFPKLISAKTDMFRYFSCIFRIAKDKNRTARAVLLRQLGLKLFYTVQTSNGCFYNKDGFENKPFGLKEWVEMGQYLGQSILGYNHIIVQMEEVKARKAQQRLKIKQIRERSKMVNQMKKGESNKKVRKLSVSSQQNGSTQSLSFNPSKLSSKSPKNSQRKRIRTSSVNLFPQFDDQAMNQLLNQIYEQGNKIQKVKYDNMSQISSVQKVQAWSDDQISEGGSDSSSASQDLDNQYKKELFGNIKSEIHNNSRPVFRKPKVKPRVIKFSQEVSEHEPNDLLSEVQDQESSHQKETIQKQQHQDLFIDGHQDLTMRQLNESIQKMNSFKLKQRKSKKYIYVKKKENTQKLSPHYSPQKETLYTAKIINFQFTLEPVSNSHHQQSRPDRLYSDYLSTRAISRALLPSDKTQIQVEDPTTHFQRIFKASDYSDEFRKTFSSVQKSVKKKYVTCSSLGRERGKKIGQDKKLGQNNIHNNTSSCFYKNLKQRKINASKLRRVHTQQDSSSFILQKNNFF